MPRPVHLVGARFLSRPNRFIVRAGLDRGGQVDAHLADPGRLRELLIPGARLRLRPAAVASRRRTAYSVALVRSPAPPWVWVSLEAARANRLAETLLVRGDVRGVGRGWNLRREVRHGHGDGRFDFLLQRPNGEKLWVEVKSVTLVEDGVGLFPDAPTERGRRHLEELIRRRLAGDAALLLFVVQRGDARRVRPHAGIDPAFAAILAAGRDAGVKLRAVKFALDPDGRATFSGALAVDARPRRADQKTQPAPARTRRPGAGVRKTSPA